MRERVETDKGIASILHEGTDYNRLKLPITRILDQVRTVRPLRLGAAHLVSTVKAMCLIRIKEKTRRRSSSQMTRMTTNPPFERIAKQRPLCHLLPPLGLSWYVVQVATMTFLVRLKTVPTEA